MNKVSKIIRDQRLNSSISQEQLARRLRVSVNYISLIENGKKNPGTVFLKKFSREFKIPHILLVQDDLILEPKNRREKELLSKYENILSDLRELFLKSAN